MHRKFPIGGAAALALLATVTTAPATAGCLGMYNSAGDPLACADPVEAESETQLRLDGLPAASSLLDWISREVAAAEEDTLAFTGIEIESVIKPSSVDVVAAVIAELRPGVEVSANLAYFGDDYVKEVQGVLGLGLTF